MAGEVAQQSVRRLSSGVGGGGVCGGGSCVVVFADSDCVGVVAGAVVINNVDVDVDDVTVVA